MLIDTLNSKNSINYIKSAGYMFISPLSSKTNTSEIIYKTSFNFSEFRIYYNKLFGNTAQHLSNN